MKFSVITPSFNQGAFLRETIESVISQKGDFDIEYFVFDGGSSDNSVKILKETESLLKNNQRITFKWKSEKDNGQADAINQGFEVATGDVVSYINSDDFYLPDAFNKVKVFFENHPNRFWVAGNCRVSDPKLSWTFFLKHLWPVNMFKQMLYVFNTINQPAVFLRRDLVTQTGKLDEGLHYAFDYDYWLRCLKIGLPGRIFSHLSVFRVHHNSKGNRGYVRQFSEDLEVINRYTNNKLILFLHRLGKVLVEKSYKQLK